MPNEYRDLKFENARIIFRNFAGKEGRFNREGVRTFSVVITDPNLANDLIDEGWNIKELSQRDPMDPPTFHLSVAVNYDNYPPKVILVTNDGEKQILTELDEENVSTVDTADINYCDIIIRPYRWKVNGKSGIKAYLKKMYVVLDDDDFERKYRYIPDEHTEDDDLPF